MFTEGIDVLGFGFGFGFVRFREVVVVEVGRDEGAGFS